VTRFLAFLSGEKGSSENTVVAYRNDLTQFAAAISEHLPAGTEIAWGRIESSVIPTYIERLKTPRNGQRCYAAASIARKTAAIKVFFQWLVAERIISTNPTENLASPQVAKSLPQPLTVEQVVELLRQPDVSTPRGIRDKAIMELLYATGLRIGELVLLNLDCIMVKEPEPHVVCRGAREKERTVPIHEQATRALAAYLDGARAKLLRGHKVGNALFINHRGQRLTRQGFWLILKGYASAAGLEGLVTPHTLRHSFATHMLRGGAKLRDVQEMLGHASIHTTQVYTQVTDDQRRVYVQAHPRAKVAAS
jgi:integrase/recombinase XerD